MSTAKSSRIVFLFTAILFAGLFTAGIGFSILEWRSLPPINLDYTQEAYASLKRRDDREAVKRLKTAARIDWYVRRPEHLFELARTAARIRDQATLRWTIEELRTHTKQSTSNPLVYYYFAVALLLPPAPTQSDVADALHSATLAAERMPDHADVRSHLGIIYTLRGEPEPAYAFFRQALQLDSTNQVAAYGLAQLQRVHPLPERETK